MEIPKFYEFCCKTTIVGGHDALERIPDFLISRAVNNPMIITDQGVRQAGLVDVLIQALNNRVSVRSVQDKVPPDSDIETVHAIARKYREKKCDSIIALGGGSVLDTAKGVNILVSEAGDNLLAFSGAGALKHKLKPLIAVPTTAGTGSEVTLVAVISDPEHNRKLLFTSYFLLPDLAIIDSRMTLTLPAHITAATAMDALSHAIEACICLARNPVSRVYAYEAIELISSNLLHVVKNPHDREGRLALATAATLAGMAFSNSMVGMVHTLGHSVGSVCHIAHGTCMAILLPYGMEYNYHKIEDQLAGLLLPLAGEEVFYKTPPFARAQYAIDKVRQINQELKMATAGAHAICFKDIKDKNGRIRVPGHKLSEIAKTALGDGSIFYNPEELDYQDCLRVLNAAFEGSKMNHLFSDFKVPSSSLASTFPYS
jgi:alcohol dehydrogenase